MGVPVVFIPPPKPIRGTPTTRFPANPSRLPNSPLSHQGRSNMMVTQGQSRLAAMAQPRPLRLMTQGAAQFPVRMESSFGPSAVKSTATVAGFGRPGVTDGKTLRIVPSNTDLMGQLSKPEEVFGFPAATMQAHTIWHHPGTEQSNWAMRNGYGSNPGYLHDRAHSSAASSIARELAMSEATMRLTEHPLLWSKRRRSASEATLRRSRSLLTASNSSASLCCTYGLHPSFPRTGSSGALLLPSPLAGAKDNGPSPPRRVMTSPSLAKRPVWRGVARPFPQDALTR